MRLRFARPAWRHVAALLLPALAVMVAMAGVVRGAPVASATAGGPATHFVIDLTPTMVAGPILTYTIQAEDDAGIVDTTFAGQVTVSATQHVYAFSANPVIITGGTGNIQMVLLSAGAATITLTQTAGTRTLPNLATNLTVLPGQTFHIDVAGPANVDQDSPFAVTITRTDGYGNVSTDDSNPDDPISLAWDQPNSFAQATWTSTPSGYLTVQGQATLTLVDYLDNTLTTTFTTEVGPPDTSVPPSQTASASVPAATDRPVADRLSGADRFATAAAVATSEFPTGNAGAVVLARSDDAADATIGCVLASAKNAPLLFTDGAALPASTLAEIVSVLPAGHTVYLIGGTSAIPASVADQLTAGGYVVARLAGADRFATAIAVADAIGTRGTVFLATGNGFADALAAGPAAAHDHAVVLLTDGTSLPSSVRSYLDAHPGLVYAVGGAAAAADPDAVPVIGSDRYATAARLASMFFAAPAAVGVASGVSYADALSGGAYLAHLDGPLLLTATTFLPAPTSAYLANVKTSLSVAYAFGGTAAITTTVTTQISAAAGS